MRQKPLPPSYRWIVLGVYSLTAGLSQFLWLNFAPILSLVEKRYGVSEGQAGLLILVFPVLFIVLAIPSGAMIDRRGYVFTVGLGTVIMAAFACLRIIDDGFGLLLIAQIGISIGQPYVVNGISKLVVDWFDREQEALANGLGTMGMFIGMAAGMGLSPVLIDHYGYRGTMAIFGVASVLTAVAFIAFARRNPGHAVADADGEGTAAAKTAFGLSEVKVLLRTSGLPVIFAIGFLGLGFFNGLTTWIEPMLAPHGIGESQAGTVGAVLIAGGIVGAAIIPGLSDHFRRHKQFLMANVVLALVTFYPLSHSHSYETVLVASGLLGFAFLPGLAILLTLCSELAGEAMTGAATGIFMLLGNAGGVVIILGMEWVNGFVAGKSFGPAVDLLLLVLAVTVAAVLFVRESAAPAAETVPPS